MYICLYRRANYIYIYIYPKKLQFAAYGQFDHVLLMNEYTNNCVHFLRKYRCKLCKFAHSRLQRSRDHVLANHLPQVQGQKT